MGISHQLADGIAEVVIDVPPVNALASKGWFELADVVTQLGKDPDCRVLILRAEGRGFCAGIDIKEVQADPGTIIDVNQRLRGRVRCRVRLRGAGDRGRSRVLPRRRDRPCWERRHRGRLERRDVWAAGGGSRRARCGHASGAARAAASDAGHGVHGGARDRGGVAAVRDSACGSGGEKLPDAARELAAAIAAKHPEVMRRAKASLNGIDPVDIKRSYRFEQGFTFELNLTACRTSPPGVRQPRDPMTGKSER